MRKFEKRKNINGLRFNGGTKARLNFLNLCSHWKEDKISVPSNS